MFPKGDNHARIYRYSASVRPESVALVARSHRDMAANGMGRYLFLAIQKRNGKG